MYRENPKTKGSGIVCCIPQRGTCPNKCSDCFFQEGRSYLEPLDENLPNMPEELGFWNVVRVNDGNDSNVHRKQVWIESSIYRMKFFNTAIPKELEKFPAPVVLTINPGELTEIDYHRINAPRNLMFVRFRVNAWNLDLCDEAVAFYAASEVPIVLTFMAYYKEPEKAIEHGYIFRKRTLNSYWAITTAKWREIMSRYEDNKWVHSCGKIEGEQGDSHCRFCGNCLREYFATMERLSQ